MQNWAEGMAPSAINDSARALLAVSAAYRDDISGALVTSGTSTAYILATNSNFTSAAFLGGQMVAFTPHITSGAAPTMTIDSIANIPLRSAPGVNLPAGVLIQGSPYVALFNNTDSSLYLHGFFGNPYNVPISAGFDYWGPTAPNSSFAFPIGQGISRIVYASLFSGNPWSIGTTYGAGDGSTTFNLPDKTGRVSAMKEAVGTRLTTAAVGVDGGTLGATGVGSQTLVTANLPAYTPSGTIVNGSIGVTGSAVANGGSVGSGPSSPGAQPAGGPNATFTVVQNPSGFTGTAQGGTSTPIRTVQPTIVCNYVMRVQ
jgi:microcystin-dependent protein